MLKIEVFVSFTVNCIITRSVHQIMPPIKEVVKFFASLKMRGKFKVVHFLMEKSKIS